MTAHEQRQQHGLTLLFSATHAYIGTVSEPLDSRSMVDIERAVTERAVAQIEAARAAVPASRLTREQRIAERWLFAGAPGMPSPSLPECDAKLAEIV